MADQVPSFEDFKKQQAQPAPSGAVPSFEDFKAQQHPSAAHNPQFQKNQQMINAREQAPDAGFFSTLGSDISNAPSKFMDWATGHPIDSAVQGIRDATVARQAQRPMAADAFKQGDYLGAAGHGLASVMPFVGPAAAGIGEEIGGGQPGQGAAHAAELLAPFGAGKAADLAQDMPALRSPITVGPGRFVKPSPGILPPVLEHMLPTPLKVASRMLRGTPGEAQPAGVLRRLEVRSPLVPEERSPIWAGSPESPAATSLDVSGIPTPLPSGRVPGTGEPAPPVTLPPSTRQPIWANNPRPSAQASPTVDPIHQDFASGRRVPTGEPIGPRPIAAPQQSTPTLPPSALDRLKGISQKADTLGYERPGQLPPDYQPPKAEVIPHPEAVKPEAQQIAQQLADEMRRSGTLPNEEPAEPIKVKKK